MTACLFIYLNHCTLIINNHRHFSFSLSAGLGSRRRCHSRLHLVCLRTRCLIQSGPRNFILSKQTVVFCEHIHLKLLSRLCVNNPIVIFFIALYLIVHLLQHFLHNHRDSSSVSTPAAFIYEFRGLQYIMLSDWLNVSRK